MRSNKIHEGRSSTAFNIFNTALMCFMMLLVLYPIYYMIIVSVSNSTAVMTGRVRFLPVGFHLDVYKQFLTDSYFLTTYRNTAIITVLGTTINIFMSTLCAYPLSRKDFYGGGVITGFVTFTMFFSGGMIPTYLLVNKLRLLNTYWSVVLPGVCDNSVRRSSVKGCKT